MKSFLLLILSLMAGCVASSKVKGCQGGWVEFTRGYKKNNNYRKIVVEIPKGRRIEITQGDVWQPEGNIFLYHDTTNKKIRVAIKQLQSEDFGKYRCKFYLQENGGKEKEEITVIAGTETDGCQGQFIQTAYRTANTTITCNYPQNSQEKFFCKENKITCEDILSTESSPKSNGTFTLTETNRGFNVSISEVSSHHAGVYRCGVKSNEGSYRAGFRKIQLEVKVPPTASTPTSTSPRLNYSTSSAVSSTTASHDTGGDSRLTAIIAVVVCVALLALLLFLVLLYKRREHPKNTRNDEAQNNNEEAAYAEIQERPQLPDSGTALKTIYVTANFPTNPSSASHEDPNTHTYSTVKDTSHQHPIYSTVNHPSGFSENPFYSTVNNPQQH